jgi:AcrR family transcriptional regulator
VSRFRSSEYPGAPEAGGAGGAARLLDAALSLFGELGFAGASVRAIAARAGVTPGLVLHHFGSKEGLRDAVDQHVLAVIDGVFTELGALDVDRDPSEVRRRYFEALFTQRPALARYLRRSLLEDSDASAAFFDGLVEASRLCLEAMRRAGQVRDTDDPDLQVLLSMLGALVAVLLPAHVERHLGESPLSESGARRWSAAERDLLEHGILGRRRPGAY